MAFKVLYKSNPKIDQWGLWATHEKKEDALKHANNSAKANKGYQFKVVEDAEVREVPEEQATSSNNDEIIEVE